MHIAFWDNQICERGTTIALFDYAYYNQTLLKNTSYIFYDKHRPENNAAVIRKFQEHFTVVHATDDFKEVDTLLQKYNITHLYMIKGGGRDQHLSRVAKNCVHCVFQCFEPHGDIYAAIAPWIKGNQGQYPVVPHMINLPLVAPEKNLRQTLGIPLSATVFGGYGGTDSFNIAFVHDVVYQVAKNNPHLYFLFANFNRYCCETLPNVIHLDAITDLTHKVEFIQTCDAMLWAQNMGETFGLAIGEFSSKNKPIIAKNLINHPVLNNQGHVHLLGEKAIWYTNPSNLTDILLNFNPAEERLKDWNAYKAYTPELVMQQFKKVFLD